MHENISKLSVEPRHSRSTSFPNPSMDLLYTDPAIPSSPTASAEHKDLGVPKVHDLIGNDLQCSLQLSAYQQAEASSPSDPAHRKTLWTVPISQPVTDITSRQPGLATAGPKLWCIPTPEVQPSNLQAPLLPEPTQNLRNQKSSHKIRDVPAGYQDIISLYGGEGTTDGAKEESTPVIRSSPVIAPECPPFQRIERGPEDDQGYTLQRKMRPLIFKRFQLRPPQISNDQSSTCHSAPNEKITTASEMGQPCTPTRFSCLPTESATDESSALPGKIGETFVDTEERNLPPIWRPAIFEPVALLPSFARAVHVRSRVPDRNRLIPTEMDDDSTENSATDMITLPLKVRRHRSRSRTSPELQGRTSEELKAPQPFSSQCEASWKAASRMLEARWLHPADLTKNEFVELLRYQGDELWFEQYGKKAEFRAVSRWVKAHRELSNAGISPNKLSDLQLDIFEFMDPLERTIFIRDYKNLKAAVTLGQTGVLELTHSLKSEQQEPLGCSVKGNDILSTVGFDAQEAKEKAFNQPTRFGISKTLVKECLGRSLQRSSHSHPSTFQEPECYSAHNHCVQPAERHTKLVGYSEHATCSLTVQKMDASAQTMLSENLDMAEKLVSQLGRFSVAATKAVREGLETVDDAHKIVQEAKQAAKQSNKTTAAESMVNDTANFIDGIERVANDFQATMEEAVQIARFKIQALIREGFDDLPESTGDFDCKTLKLPSVDQTIPTQDAAKCFDHHFIEEVNPKISDLGQRTSHSSLSGLGADVNLGNFHGDLHGQKASPSLSGDGESEMKRRKSAGSGEITAQYNRKRSTANELGVAEASTTSSSTMSACLHVKFEDLPHVDDSISTCGIYPQRFPSQVHSEIMDELTLPPPGYVQIFQHMGTLKRSPMPRRFEKKQKSLRRSFSRAKLFFGSVGRKSSGVGFTNDITC